ncbi:MAG: DUF5752 family protein [Nitrospiraceae bacterium]|nr:DUF5752 family protein [Nitrospiraceae bacterium]
MIQAAKPFIFNQCITIPKATGKWAKNLKELKEKIAVISPVSIYHHTYQYFLKGHILEYTNDFAQWAGESLEARALSEHLSIVDPYEFNDIEDLRKKLLNVIDDYMERFTGPRDAVQGNEFFFNEGFTIIFPAGMKVRNLAEFQIAIKSLEKGSIYYHFYDARARHGVDDFSTWMLDALGKGKLAAKIKSIDPFMHNTEEVRAHIIEAVGDELRSEAEEGDTL